MYWKGGKFSIKSVIIIMRYETDVMDDHSWDMVWKTPAQQRVRALLWLSCHDRILGNSNRFKRNMTDNPKCYTCGESNILRDCPAARLVWKKMGGLTTYQRFWQGNVKEWIVFNVDNNITTLLEYWPTLFAVTTWWLWRWRNCCVF